MNSTEINQYKTLTVKELRNRAREMGYSPSGWRKPQLFAVVIKNLPLNEAKTFSIESPSSSPEKDFDSMTIKELREYLKKYNRTGIFKLKKNELIEIAGQIKSA